VNTRPLHLFVFADALGWDLAQARGTLADLLPHRRRVETLLGYSCTCDPTILTGVPPDEHGHFSFYIFDPAHSPFAWARPLGWLPDRIAGHHRVRNRLSRWAARRGGYTGYFQLYSVPFGRLPYLAYTELKDIYEPGGILGGQETIFARWARSGVRWVRSDWRRDDAHNVAHLLAEIDRGEVNLAYLFTAGLDAVMHRHGTRHAAVDAAFLRFEGWLREIRERALRRYPEVRIHVFSDHGMVDTTAVSPLLRDFDRLGLEYGRDYAAVWDSTMVRFWFPGGPGVRSRVEEWLGIQPVGRIVDDAELARRRCLFADRRYGELFYLLHSGTIFAPSYMNLGRVAGMHGFSPDEPGNAACLLSSHAPAVAVAELKDLFGLMDHAATQ
jgi:predicted AlkP superfamily pyrophosphatase or phosphodiesterase